MTRADKPLALTLGDPAGIGPDITMLAFEERFALLTVHIRYGATEQDRLEEIQSLARYVADQLAPLDTRPQCGQRVPRRRDGRCDEVQPERQHQ